MSETEPDWFPSEGDLREVTDQIVRSGLGQHMDHEALRGLARSILWTAHRCVCRICAPSAPMLTANGLRGATLHTGTGIEPLRSVEVTWGRGGRILSMSWEGFRDLVADALDEDRIPQLGTSPSA